MITGWYRLPREKPRVAPAAPKGEGAHG